MHAFLKFWASVRRLALAKPDECCGLERRSYDFGRSIPHILLTLFFLLIEYIKGLQHFLATQIDIDYSEELKMQKFWLLPVGFESVAEWTFGLADYLVRRRSLVQTPLEGVKISAL